MTESTTIGIGNLVKDKITGFQGYITSRLQSSTGMIQFSVTPRWDEKAESSPAGTFFDPDLLEYIDKGLADLVTEPDAKLNVALGEEVEDESTGMRGIAIEMTTFINGCTYFTFHDKKRNNIDGKPPRAFADHRRLKRLGAGLVLGRAFGSDGSTGEGRELGSEPPKGGPSRRADRP